MTPEEKRTRAAVDELHTKAVETLAMLGSTTDDAKREEYLTALLVVVYQSGQIDMQATMIKKNEAQLAGRFSVEET